MHPIFVVLLGGRRAAACRLAGNASDLPALRGRWGSCASPGAAHSR